MPSSDLNRAHAVTCQAAPSDDACQSIWPWSAYRGAELALGISGPAACRDANEAKRLSSGMAGAIAWRSKPHSIRLSKVNVGMHASGYVFLCL